MPVRSPAQDLRHHQRPDPGAFPFHACEEKKEIEKEILDTIAQIKKGEISQKDIDKIKINTKADFIFSLESSTEVASLYGSYFVRGNINPLLEYEKNVDKLTKENLIDVANKYLNKNNSTTVILKQEEK